MRKPSVLKTLGSACTAALLLSACTTLTVPDGGMPETSATPAGHDVGKTTKNVPGVKWPDGSDFQALQLHREMAPVAEPDRDYRIVYTTKDLADRGDLFVPFALANDGSLVGGTSKQPAVDLVGGLLQPADDLGVYANGNFTPFTTSGAEAKPYKPLPIIGGSVGQGQAVWAENFDEQLMTTGWKIAGAPLDTGIATTIASSRDGIPGDNDEITFGWPRPLVTAGRAFWQTQYSNADDSYTTSKILSASLDGSGPIKNERSNAEFPARFGDVVATADRVRDDEGGTNAGRKISLMVPGEDDTELLHLSDRAPQGVGFDSFGADGTVFSFSYLGDFYIVDTAKGRVVTTRSPSTGHISGVVHCGQRVSWSFIGSDCRGLDTRYVYDAERAVLRVVKNPGFTGAAQCAGDYLSWTIQSGKGKKTKTWDVVTRWEN